MDKLPPTIIQHIYEYANTYDIKFDKVLKQLSAHCFTHNCQICFKPYSRYFCYCETCRTYLRSCQQIYFSPGDMEEDYK